MELILQEVSTEREIEIPEPVREVFKLWRPAPLYRAHRLEKALGTPAKIFYKYEGVSPAGSHKPNTAVPQAFYNAAGRRQAPDHRDRRRPVGHLAGLCRAAVRAGGAGVPGARVSYDQKPYRRAVMETYGARCVPSPSTETNYGRACWPSGPTTPGSLGIAISEAVELAVQRDDTKYALGSVLNHVLMHQTIIGLEAMEQMEMAGDDWPDVVVGCTGGGSNFAGIAFPFIGHGLRGGAKPRIVAVEPAACPSLTRGKYAYDFGDTGHMTPLTKMHTLGSTFTPPGFHAGGLRYHGMAPLVSHLKELGLMEAVAYTRPVLRGRRAVCARRRHRARARGQPRRQGRHRGSPALQARRQERDHPVQPVRPRPLRHDGLPEVLCRRAQGRAVRREGTGHGAAEHFEQPVQPAHVDGHLGLARTRAWRGRPPTGRPRPSSAGRWRRRPWRSPARGRMPISAAGLQQHAALFIAPSQMSPQAGPPCGR
jgi:pyridoxal-phosphate dependent TrpB-like enzyme